MKLHELNEFIAEKNRQIDEFVDSELRPDIAKTRALINFASARFAEGWTNPEFNPLYQGFEYIKGDRWIGRDQLGNGAADPRTPARSYNGKQRCVTRACGSVNE